MSIVVAIGVGPHDVHALQVPTCALPRCALQLTNVSGCIRQRTALPVWRSYIWGTNRRGARTHFLRIARRRGSAAYGSSCLELTLIAAVFVCIVAYCAAHKLAGSAIAATVGCTGASITTIAVFAFLNDAVAALLALVSLDSSVIRQAVGMDAIATNTAAYLTNCAWRKFVDPSG